jgi:threonine synthase
MGTAGNITAYWMGFNQYYASGKAKKLPKMMGFQAAGSAPLVTGQVFTKPETIATAIRIGNPANWAKALNVRAESGGAFHSVTDVEILAAYKLLAGEEGVFCEPASAASVAGLLKVSDQIPSGATIVCVLTGNGIKDPDTAIACAGDEKLHKGVSPDITSVAKVMGF